MSASAWEVTDWHDLELDARRCGSTSAKSSTFTCEDLVDSRSSLRSSGRCASTAASGTATTKPTRCSSRDVRMYAHLLVRSYGVSASRRSVHSGVTVAMTLAALLLMSLATAHASAQTTWQDAVARASYPVYQPASTLGLSAHVTIGPCGDGKVSVGATYSSSRSRKGPRLGIYEGSPYLCGNAGESNPIRTLSIKGARATLSVFCSHSPPHCDDTNGYRQGYLLIVRNPGPQPTMVQLTGLHVGLTAFLRVARSLRLVRPAAGTLHIGNFLSPDRKFWCQIAAPEAWCVTDGTHQYGAHLTPRGSVTACIATGPPDVCAQNWDDSAPVLRTDQRVRLDGFSCRPAPGAMTCTVVDGDSARGKGFTITATSVSAVGGAPVTAGR